MDENLVSQSVCHEEKIQQIFRCAHAGCSKQYGRKSHLVRHDKQVHNSLEIPIKNVFVCDSCQEEYMTKQSLCKHIIKKHMKKFPFPCKFCSRGFEKETLLAAHEFLHTGEKLLKCLYCDKKFENQTSRYKHQKNHKIFKCEDCGAELMVWKDMLKHKKTHIQDRFECDICQRIFKKRHNIMRHMRIHPIFEQRQIFPCKFCPRAYPYKSNLMHHINSSHFDRRYPCNYPGCNAKLITMSTLRRHIERIHNNPTVRKVPKFRKKRRDAGVRRKTIIVELAGNPLHIEDEVRTTKDEDIEKE